MLIVYFAVVGIVLWWLINFAVKWQIKNDLKRSQEKLGEKVVEHGRRFYR